MLALALAPLPPTLVVDRYVVGARVGGKWSPVEIGKGWKSRPPATLREIGVGRLGQTFSARFTDEEVPQGVYLAGDRSIENGILIGGATPRVPRRTTELPKVSTVYAGVLRRYLDTHGLKGAKTRITRIVQVDLDGDGTREILIEARNRDDLDSRGLTVNFGPTDYSVVLLRALRGGRVTETALAPGRTPAADGLVRKLRAIADVDGDGRMEVVLSYSAWEAFGGALWNYRAGTPRLLVEDGSGV